MLNEAQLRGITEVLGEYLEAQRAQIDAQATLLDARVREFDLRISALEAAFVAARGGDAAAIPGLTMN